MSVMASEITGNSTVYSAVFFPTDIEGNTKAAFLAPC